MDLSSYTKAFPNIKKDTDTFKSDILYVLKTLEVKDCNVYPNHNGYGCVVRYEIQSPHNLFTTTEVVMSDIKNSRQLFDEIIRSFNHSNLPQYGSWRRASLDLNICSYIFSEVSRELSLAKKRILTQIESMRPIINNKIKNSMKVNMKKNIREMHYFLKKKLQLSPSDCEEIVHKCMNEIVLEDILG